MKNSLRLLLLFLILSSCSLNEWSFKAELPDDASEIKEFSYSEMDYTYYLKANISRAQFETYISHFKMSLHTDNSTYSDDITWLDTKSTFEHDVSTWWDSELKKDSMYVSQEGRQWIIARFSHGTMYLNAHSH
jgi:hypothetical protein